MQPPKWIGKIPSTSLKNRLLGNQYVARVSEIIIHENFEGRNIFITNDGHIFVESDYFDNKLSFSASITEDPSVVLIISLLFCEILLIFHLLLAFY